MYDFDGWNDRADGTGKTYSLTDLKDERATIRAANATLYAKWVRLVVIEYYSQATTPAYYVVSGDNAPTATLVETRAVRTNAGYTLLDSIAPYDNPDGTPVDVSDYTLHKWRGDYELSTANYASWPSSTRIFHDITMIYVPSTVSTQDTGSAQTAPATANARIRWYAVWKQNTVTVTYRHSRDSAGDALTTGTLPGSETVDISVDLPKFSLGPTSGLSATAAMSNIAGWQATMVGAPFASSGGPVKQYALTGIAAGADVYINTIRTNLLSSLLARDVILTPKLSSSSSP